MLPFFFYLSGCGSDTVTNNNNNNSADTNVVIYDSLIVVQWNTSNSTSSVDLYSGKVLPDLSSGRDIQMRSQNGLNANFYFRDGTFVTPAGYECRFKKLYTGLLGFDTVSVIPGGIEVSSFTDQSTESYGYFNVSSNQQMVIGFYLKGKFDNGQTPHQVFGVLYLNSGNTGGLAGYSQMISVKINKDGQNHFKP